MSQKKDEEKTLSVDQFLWSIHKRLESIDSCSSDKYIEKLKDGRRVEYTIKEEGQKYILQIEVFRDERKN